MDAFSAFVTRALVASIEKKREEYLRPLLKGQMPDYAEYKARCAYLCALDDVERMIEAISLDDDRRRNGAFGIHADHP